MNDALSKFLTKRITVVSKFMNAATILLEDKPGDDITFVEPSRDLTLVKGVKYLNTLF